MTTRLSLLDPGFTDPFESAFRRIFSPARFELEAQTPEMRLDISETDNAYVVKADIPGTRKEDINVRIDGNLVRIDAEVKREKELQGAGGRVLRSERYYGPVSRTVTLGQDVDEAKADAKYVDGVLTLELPKKASAAARTLTVH